MKYQRLLIVLVVLISLVPAYYVNQKLLQLIQPRRSILQLFLYIITCFALVFAYTFLLVIIIAKLFPHTKG